jgi:hypothetical protein
MGSRVDAEKGPRQGSTRGNWQGPAPHCACSGWHDGGAAFRSFKVARIYATLAADGRTANLKLAPDEQVLKCLTAPDAFAPVPGGWGSQGWTMATLAALSTAELEAALEMAWRHATPKRTSAPRSRRR